jgi:hypothetical protein
MAVSAAKTFVAGEILTASDLNTLNTNILEGGQDLGWPATKTRSLAGEQLTLDDGGTSSLTAGTNNRLDLALNGADLFRWDGTVTTPVNGFDFIAAATGTTPQIKALGTDTNIGINLVPKGSGHILNDGHPIDDGVRRAAAANVVARTVQHRAAHIEANHIGEAQSLGF